MDPILWTSKKQPTVETSTFEAEFIIVKHVFIPCETDPCTGRNIYIHRPASTNK